jgi:hypothetical protein
MPENGGHDMTHQPQIQPRAAQPYAGIPATVNMDTISTAVDSGFPELFGWLASPGHRARRTAIHPLPGHRHGR